MPRAPVVAGTFRVNGLVELLALDGRAFLALERAYAAGAGYAIKLFRISLAGASSVFAQPRLGGAGGGGRAGGTGRVGAGLRPVTKTELVDFGDLLGRHDLALDNLEGMALAPRLADGRRPLVVVADDNFSEGDQRTLFVALALPGSL